MFSDIFDKVNIGRENALDLVSLVGLIIGLGMVIGGYLIEGGHLGGLVQIPSFMIVVGGTAGVILFSNKVSDVTGAFGALLKTFLSKEKEMPTLVISKIMTIANICRSEGLLQLQSLCNSPEFSSPDFTTLKLGMMLALDMKTADEIEEALEADVAAFASKRQAQAAVFAAAGGFLPTLGVLGTVMSLIHVLGNMTDPESLVGSIAGAFLATFYGVGFANLFFLPFSARIKNMMKREVLMREMMIAGICMIVKGETARSVENKLSVYYQAFPGGDKSYLAGVTK